MTPVEGAVIVFYNHNVQAFSKCFFPGAKE